MNITELKATLAAAEKRADENYDNGQAWKKIADERETRIADLKERLANANRSGQFMRGYIARIQEDDVVREELVQVAAMAVAMIEHIDGGHA